MRESVQAKRSRVFINESEIGYGGSGYPPIVGNNLSGQNAYLGFTSTSLTGIIKRFVLYDTPTPYQRLNYLNKLNNISLITSGSGIVNLQYIQTEIYVKPPTYTTSSLDIAKFYPVFNFNRTWGKW